MDGVINIRSLCPFDLLNYERLKSVNYNVSYSLSGHSGLTYATNFYTKKMVKRRKYYVFGPVVSVEAYDYLFSVWTHINDPTLNKDDIRKTIKKQLELLARKMQIANNEII